MIRIANEESDTFLRPPFSSTLPGKLLNLFACTQYSTLSRQEQQGDRTGAAPRPRQDNPQFPAGATAHYPRKATPPPSTLAVGVQVEMPHCADRHRKRRNQT